MISQTVKHAIPTLLFVLCLSVASVVSADVGEYMLVKDGVLLYSDNASSTVATFDEGCSSVASYFEASTYTLDDCIDGDILFDWPLTQPYDPPELYMYYFFYVDANDSAGYVFDGDSGGSGSVQSTDPEVVSSSTPATETYFYQISMDDNFSLGTYFDDFKWTARDHATESRRPIGAVLSGQDVDVSSVTSYAEAVSLLWSLAGNPYYNAEECTTCTRIVSFNNPSYDQQFVATSTSFAYSFDYYISADDYIEPYLCGPTETDQCGTIIEWEVRHMLGNMSGFGNPFNEHLDSGQQTVWTSGTTKTFTTNIDLSATGTYYFKASIKNVQDQSGPWWLGGAIELTQEYFDVERISAHASTYTTPEEIERYAQQDYLNYIMFESCTGMCRWAQDTIDRFIYTPPLGYAFIIRDIFNATTSTTSGLALTLTGATGTPLAGLSLTLDAGSAIEDAIDTLSYNGMWDRFMALWRVFWYTILALWILREVFGGASLIGGGSVEGDIQGARRGKRNSQDRKMRYESARMNWRKNAEQINYYKRH